MASSNAENVDRWRKARIEAGWRPVSVWIDPDTQERLQTLRRHFSLKIGGKWSQSRVVRKAIDELSNGIER